MGRNEGRGRNRLHQTRKRTSTREKEKRQGAREVSFARGVGQHVTLAPEIDTSQPLRLVEWTVARGFIPLPFRSSCRPAMSRGAVVLPPGVVRVAHSTAHSATQPTEMEPTHTLHLRRRSRHRAHRQARRHHSASSPSPCPSLPSGSRRSTLAHCPTERLAAAAAAAASSPFPPACCTHRGRPAGIARSQLTHLTHRR